MVLIPSPAPAVTELLRAVEAGSAGARDELMTAVYAEMRSVARRIVDAGGNRHRVAPAELVHGSALKLMVQQKLSARDRANFLACSAQVMRRVLTDHLSPQDGQRGNGARVTLVSTLAEEPTEEIDFAALHMALERLARVSAESSRLVELRYFGGMTIEEIAQLDGLPAATVNQRWRAARAWLHDALAMQREPNR